MDVIEQMQESGLTGLTSPDLIIDGVIHRFRPDWEPKAAKKRAWYVLFTFRTDAGKELIVGSFGWFKGADTYSFNVSLKDDFKLTDEEKQRYAKEQAAKRELAQIEKQKEQFATAKRATAIFNKLPTQGHSKYLQRKKVNGFNCRFTRGSVVIPVYGVDFKLSGLQFINADGDKKFLTGTVKKGKFCILGQKIQKNFTGYIALVEGYATGCSVKMATGWNVFVAFDAGNLIHVAKAMRSLYQYAKIVVCGDDDYGNKDNNAGRKNAELAAQAVGGVAVFPVRKMEVSA